MTDEECEIVLNTLLTTYTTYVAEGKPSSEINRLLIQALKHSDFGLDDRQAQSLYNEIRRRHDQQKSLRDLN